MKVLTRGRTRGLIADRTSQPGKTLARDSLKEAKAVPLISHPEQPKASNPINDHYCVNVLQTGLLAWSKQPTPGETLNSLFQKTLVNSVVVNPVLTAPRLSQKKDISPSMSGCYQKYKLKYVKDVFCVDQFSFVKPVTNVQIAASNLPVGARLQNYWQTWLDLGAGPKVVQTLREGYTLPFQIRPKLTRSPTISCYVNPHRNLYLLEKLQQLMDKNAVELVQNEKSLGFFNQLFLVPKPNNHWRPILDLSKLRHKMETWETIRTSLQQGEWVTSIDFKNAYFHIPIQEQSRKYLRFHIQGRTYSSRLCHSVSPHLAWSSL